MSQNKESPNKVSQSTPDKLLEKLNRLDERLVNIWLIDTENGRQNLDDDDIWEIFVVLLESRVELLKTCRDAGIKLSAEACMPGWLERLVNSKTETRVRELRSIAQKLKQRRKIGAYESVGAARPPEVDAE